MENIPPLQELSLQVRDAVDEARLRAGREGLWVRPSASLVRIRRLGLLARWALVATVVTGALVFSYRLGSALLSPADLSNGGTPQSSMTQGVVGVGASIAALGAAVIAVTLSFGWKGLLFGRSDSWPVVPPYTRKKKSLELSRAEEVHERCKEIASRLRERPL